MKKYISLLMLALLILAWYVTYNSWIGNGLKAAEAKENAAYFEEKGLYLEAVKQYEEAVSYEGATENSMIAIADAYKKMGNSSMYEKALKETLNIYPESIAAISRLNNYYNANNGKDKAISLLKKAYEKYPENEKIKALYDSFKGSYTVLYFSYENIGPYYNGYAVYSKGGKYGLLDSTGEIFIPAVYDWIGFPAGKDKWIPVTDENGSYYITKEGYKAAVTEENYDRLGNMVGSAILAQKEGKYGYLNKKLEVKTDFIYENATSVQKKLGAVCQTGSWALTSDGEKLLTDFVYSDVVKGQWDNASKNGVIWVCQNGKYFLVDKKGNCVGETVYDLAKAFVSEEPCPVCRNGEWGFADANGELVIPCQYEDAEAFCQGFAPIKKDGLWGFIDRDGLAVTPTLFTSAYPPNEKGIAPVEQDGVWTLIQFDVFK